MSDSILNEKIIPSIDKDGSCVSSDGRRILNCSVDDKGNIRGITEDNTKALFDSDSNEWLYGKDISKLNLINLADRTLEERQRLGSIGGLKAKENRDAKKNFNELARAMLEQTMSERQIRSVMGEDTNVLLDDSVASVILGAMLKGALNGSFKCAEFIRDTSGYKPKDELSINGEIISESDKALIDKALKSG